MRISRLVPEILINLLNSIDFSRFNPGLIALITAKIGSYLKKVLPINMSEIDFIEIHGDVPLDLIDLINLFDYSNPDINTKIQIHLQKLIAFYMRKKR